MKKGTVKNCFKVEVVEQNGLFILCVQNKLCSARISLHGAHVMSFIPNGTKDVLWMSKKTMFEANAPIRGGVPVCWPWFGNSMVADRPNHGFARLAEWKLSSITEGKDGSTEIRLKLDHNNPTVQFVDFPFELDFIANFGSSCEIKLRATNLSEKPQVIEEALHTYFAISDIANVSVCGLDKAKYINTVKGAKQVNCVQSGIITFDTECDRIFDSTKTVEIHDKGWKRVIRVSKKSSNNTVVWNPWIDKSKAMPDFGDEEYHEMVCVEAANVRHNSITLNPNESCEIRQKWEVLPL